MHVSREEWGTTADGRTVERFTLTNDAGMHVQLTNLGCCVLAVETPDRNGKTANVNLTYPSAAEYRENPSYFGAFVGRFANRIGGGRFRLDGKDYQLACNQGGQHLHGGDRGFTHRLWDATVIEQVAMPGQADSALVGVGFEYTSVDGEENYPGTLSVRVMVTLRRDNRLVLAYEAETDAPTILNLTNHCYWNLTGRGDVLDHRLQIHADRYVATDANLIPTGEILPVAGTPNDFTAGKPIGADIEAAGGYDLCYVVPDWDGSLKHIAHASDPASGRTMEVWSTEPGVQLYTAEHFDGSAVSAGHGRRSAFCLECQHLPDSPNHSDFPSTVLRPGKTYRQITEHRFDVVEGDE